VIRRHTTTLVFWTHLNTARQGITRAIARLFDADQRIFCNFCAIPAEKTPGIGMRLCGESMKQVVFVSI
jgi:hypothetical protein